VHPELAEWKSLDALVLRLLAKNRDQRPRDVAEVLKLLDAIEHVAPLRRVTKVEEAPPQPRADEIPIPAPNPGRITRLSPDSDSTPGKAEPKKRTRLLPEILIAVLVSMVFFFSWWEGKQREQAQHEAEAYSAAISQPALGSQAQEGLYQQAKTLSDQGQYEKAAPIFEQACKAGYAQACSDLGVLYAHAHGVAKDFAQAATLYAKACDGGIGAACKRLGDAYALGAGVAVDNEKARQAYKTGCSLGNKPACTANAPKSILDEVK
jgi:tetratricopeptide (TPR) repeat protein